jgi:hypothetical protein
MMPPIKPGAHRVFLGADLSLWAVYHSFDKATECRSARDDLKTRMFSNTGLKDDPEMILRKGTNQNQMIYFAQCIASDDPRLKGN